MRPVKATYGPNDLAGLRIDDIDAAAVREVKTMGPRIGKQIVPATITAELPLIEDLLGLLREKLGRENRRAGGNDGNCKYEAIQAACEGHNGSKRARQIERSTGKSECFIFRRRNGPMSRMGRDPVGWA